MLKKNPFIRPAYSGGIRPQLNPNDPDSLRLENYTKTIGIVLTHQGISKQFEWHLTPTAVQCNPIEESWNSEEIKAVVRIYSIDKSGWPYYTMSVSFNPVIY